MDGACGLSKRLFSDGNGITPSDGGGTPALPPMNGAQEDRIPSCRLRRQYHTGLFMKNLIGYAAGFEKSLSGSNQAYAN